MTQSSNKLFPNPLITFNSASLTSSFQVMGTLPAPARIIKFKNIGTTAVTISWDGTNAHESLQPNEVMIVDVSTNREVGTQMLEVVQGQTFFIKGTAGTGTIYISSYDAY